jgi:hypothetical protein
MEEDFVKVAETKDVQADYLTNIGSLFLIVIGGSWGKRK